MAMSSAAAAAADGAAGTAPVEVPEMPPAGSAATSMPGDVVAALNRNPQKETLVESIKSLKEQQSAMKAAKMDLQRQLENACNAAIG